MSNKDKIYLDYASTTPLDQKVKSVISGVEKEFWANPASIHSFGVLAKEKLSLLRNKAATSLSARPKEIFFTSGGTESNNLAIFGVFAELEMAGLDIRKLHAITTNIEHSSVLNCFRELERRGLSVTFVAVDSNGIISPDSIRNALRDNTVLVSVMYANNEIGTIQPIGEISRLIRKHNSRTFSSSDGKKSKTFFHTDACQAPLYLDLSVAQLGVDLLSLDGHKMYGPKGVGALYVKSATPVGPTMFGGGQEAGIRPTTENLPAIAGFEAALSIASANQAKESARLNKLRDYFFRSVQKYFPGTIINGDTINRLPNNANISFLGFDAEELSIRLDAYGVACSTKSACLKHAD